MVIDEDAVIHADPEQDAGEAHADHIERADAEARGDEAHAEGEKLREQNPSERPQGAIENPERRADEHGGHDDHQAHFAAHLRRDLGRESRTAGEQEARLAWQGASHGAVDRSSERLALVEGNERARGGDGERGRGPFGPLEPPVALLRAEHIEDAERVESPPRQLSRVERAGQHRGQLIEPRAHRLRLERCNDPRERLGLEVPDRPRGELWRGFQPLSAGRFDGLDAR
jgi:hypothetical protein